MGLKNLARKWLKPRPESGLDCLICAEFARQRMAVAVQHTLIWLQLCLTQSGLLKTPRGPEVDTIRHLSV